MSCVAPYSSKAATNLDDFEFNLDLPEGWGILFNKSGYLQLELIEKEIKSEIGKNITLISEDRIRDKGDLKIEIKE